MARTLEEVKAEFEKVSEDTRKAYDAFKSRSAGSKIKAGITGGTLEQKYKIAVRDKDKEDIAVLKPLYEEALAKYNELQQRKNALNKELKAAQKQAEEKKTKQVQAKSAKNLYDKALANLEEARLDIKNYKGEEKYQEAYRKAQAVFDAGTTAGAKLPPLPTPVIEVPPKVVEDQTDGGKGTGEDTSGVVTEDLKALVDKLAIDPETTKIYQKALQPFGYKGPIDGQYSIPLGQLIASIAGQRAVLPQVLQGKTLTEFIQNPANVARLGIQTSGTGAAAAIPYKDISAPTEAAATIQRVFANVLGREASAKEISALTKILNKEEDLNPSKTVNGRTTGGINRDQFLTDLIKTGAYETDKKAFPGILSNLAKEYSTSKQAITTSALEELRQTAMANGLDLDANFGSELKDWQAKIAAGARVDDFKNKIRAVARQHLPESVRNQIDPSIDLRSAYAPYVNSYSTTFGIPANQVKIADIERIALTDKGFAPIWEFNAKKRSLPGWDQTPEAYDYVDSVANQVLRDFGF